MLFFEIMVICLRICLCICLGICFGNCFRFFVVLSVVKVGGWFRLSRLFGRFERLVVAVVFGVVSFQLYFQLFIYLFQLSTVHRLNLLGEIREAEQYQLSDFLS